MLSLTTLVLGELNTNCYLISDSQNRAVIIDPADEGDLINQQLLQQQLVPQAIILTHAHFDHVLGLLEVKLAWNIPIYLHEADYSLLEKTQQSAQYWLKHTVDPVPPADHVIKEGQVFSFLDEPLETLHTPGHTPGSCSFVHQSFVITGDTLFDQAVGRTDFSYSKPMELQQSLKRLSNLPSSSVVYPGHGESTTIGESKVWLEEQSLIG